MDTRFPAALAIVVAVAVLASLSPAAAAESGGNDGIEILDSTETTADGYGTLDAEGPYGTFDVALEPADGEAAPGEVTTYEVVVSGPTNGIEAYDIKLVIEDSSVAQFVNFTETATENEGPGQVLSNSEIVDSDWNPTEAGPVLYLSAALGQKPFDGADEIVIAEVQMQALGDSGDTTDVVVPATFDVPSDTSGPVPPRILNNGGREQAADQRTPAAFTVTNLSVDIAGTNTPAAGEDLEAEVAIENIGDTEVSDEITLSSPAFGEASTTVTLAGGESTTETLSLSTADGDAGDYTLTAESDHSTDTAEATVLAEPGFAVDIVDTTEQAEGEDTEATVEIENTAGTQDTNSVSLSSPALGETSADVTLAGGESTTETLSLSTTVGDAGEYTLTAETADDSDTADVAVLEQAAFEVGINNISYHEDSLTEGDRVDIEYELQNTGEVQATQDIDLLVNGTVVETAAATLTGEGVGPFQEFSYETEFGDAPAIEVAVATEDDTANETVAVESAPLFDASVSVDENEVNKGDTVNISYEVTNAGNVSGTQHITITAGGTFIDTGPAPELGVGETANGTVSYTTSLLDAPEFNVTVESETDSASEAVTVLAPGMAKLSDMSINGADNQTVVPSDIEMDMAMNAQNLGLEADEFDVTLSLNSTSDTVEITKTVELEGRESTPVVFDINTSTLDGDVYDMAVSTTGNTLTGGFVTAFDVTGDGNAATDTTGDGLLNDVDGDGEFDIFDVQAFFDSFDTSKVQSATAAFNFDGDDNLDIFDVQALFDQLP